MTQYDGKVFGIGFYKTGTTTLFEALRILGYNTINGDTPGSYPGADDGATLIRQIDAGDFHLPTFAMFDAFTDTRISGSGRRFTRCTRTRATS